MVTSSADPPFTVRIGAGAISHIQQKHISDRFEAPLWAEFLASHGDVTHGLENEIQRSLDRPLFLVYDQHDTTSSFLHKTRELVTRPGLLVVVRCLDEHSGDVVTAFFPSETWNEKPRRRWLAAVRSRIELYANVVTFGQARKLVTPPPAEDVFPSADPAGERRNLRFVSEERLGFRDEEVEGQPLRVWRRPGAWPVA